MAPKPAVANPTLPTLPTLDDIRAERDRTQATIDQLLGLGDSPENFPALTGRLALCTAAELGVRLVALDVPGRAIRAIEPSTGADIPGARWRGKTLAEAIAKARREMGEAGR